MQSGPFFHFGRAYNDKTENAQPARGSEAEVAMTRERARHLETKEHETSSNEK